ncbi:MAG: hypothetical protein K2J89_00030, partial [Clostridia bacterium]|nr:hypothetical protein [Clostridia bacterium]
MDIRKKKFKGICLVSALVILCFLSVISFFMPNNSADAVSDSSSTRELLLTNYATRSDGLVFDGDNLSVFYKQLTGTATYEKVEELASGKLNSDNFRANNDGNDITVKINGLVWNVMYLSTNKQGDPIVTLWLAGSNQLPSEFQSMRWNDYYDNSNGAYPANMYGTSKIRAVTLNNGGRYATSLDTLSADDVTQELDNPFAIYTMAGIDGSLTSFIDTPSNVAWQELQSAEYAQYSFNNDSYSMASPGNIYNNIDYTIPPSGVEDRATTYTAWKEDNIWLPSMTEVGDRGSTNGIWHTSNNQRSNAGGVETWLRSAAIDYYSNPIILLADGSNIRYLFATEGTVCAARPAFHLNLAKANAASAKAMTSLPQDIEMSYNGEEQGVESKYSQDFLDKVDIKYYDEGSSTPRTTKPTAVGNYTVKYTLSKKYYWSDNLDGAERTKSFTITQRRLDYPTFDNSKYSIQKNYAGDEEISFTLGSYDKNYIEVTYSGTDNGVSYD